MFLSRTPRPPDRTLPFKTAALIAGIVLILLSDRLDDPRYTWIALGLLAIAFVLRFVPRRREPPEENDRSDEAP